MEGDIDKAEAVYASNRRAGVDSHKSWLAVTAAMFVHGETDRALALLAQVSETTRRRLGGGVLGCPLLLIVMPVWMCPLDAGGDAMHLNRLWRCRAKKRRCPLTRRYTGTSSPTSAATTSSTPRWRA